LLLVYIVVGVFYVFGPEQIVFYAFRSESSVKDLVQQQWRSSSYLCVPSTVDICSCFPGRLRVDDSRSDF